MSLFATLGAMLRNAYIGLWVLSAEVYWLAGPDAAYRRGRAGRAAAIAGCRERLRASGAKPIQDELDRLETEDAAAATRFAGERADFLERLRRRSGLNTFNFK